MRAALQWRTTDRRVSVFPNAVAGDPTGASGASGLPPARDGGDAPAMPLDIDALETSFDLIAPRGDELVDVFYARLFTAAPAVKPLFAHTDLRRQKAMLLATLVLLRKSLRDLDAIVPKLRALG